MNWFPLPRFTTPFTPEISWCLPGKNVVYINRTIYAHQMEMISQIPIVHNNNRPCWSEIQKIYFVVLSPHNIPSRITGFFTAAISDEFQLLQEDSQTIWEAMYPVDEVLKLNTPVSILYFEILDERQLWLTTLWNIVFNLNDNGCCIIKISEIFYKFDVDVLFQLTTMFVQVHIVHPEVSRGNIHYVVCKYFRRGSFSWPQLPTSLESSVVPSEMFAEHVPVFFRHRLEEILLTTGSRYIEYLNRQVVSQHSILKYQG
jgi:hypothetical protein